MQLIPWADDSLNLKVVRERLALSTVSPERLSAGIRRCHENYFWCMGRPSPGAGSPNYIIKETMWSQLKIGVSYLVVLFRVPPGFTTDVTEMTAAVMHFQGYEKVTKEKYELQKAEVIFQVQQAKDEMALLKDFDADLDSDDDVDRDELFEESLEARMELKEDIKSLKEGLRSRKYDLKFKSLDGTERVHTINPHGPFFNSPSLKFDVLELTSSSWMLFDGAASPSTPSLNSKWEEKMDKLRRLGAQFVIQQSAACRIQRAWKRSRSNPEYTLCKKRLREEYDQLSEDQQPKERGLRRRLRSE